MRMILRRRRKFLELVFRIDVIKFMFGFEIINGIWV